MNVLFLNPHPENGAKNNLYRKFSSQISCTSKIVDRVFYTTYDHKQIYINEYGKPEMKAPIGRNYPINKNVIVMHNTMRAIRKWINDYAIDIVYIRENPATYSYGKTFKKLKKLGISIVIEIPTYPGTYESKNSSRKLFFAAVKTVEFFFQSVYEKYATLFTLIGEKADTYKGVPAINIENGIDIAQIPQKAAFEDHPGELHLLAVAAISYWHGYDRIVKGLIEYYIRHKEDGLRVYLHICGNSPDGSLSAIQETVRAHHLEDKVFVHGFLSGASLNDMYNKCDIAIGSLGLFRQNIVVDTTLKLTEYTARGIPFVYCTKSNNVPEKCNYCMRVPETEDPINILRIIEFYNGLDLKSVSSQMREYAANELDWSNQFSLVIKKVKQIKEIYNND